MTLSGQLSNILSDLIRSWRRRAGSRLLITLVLASGLTLYCFTASLLDGLFLRPPAAIDAEHLYVVARGAGGASRANVIEGNDVLSLRQSDPLLQDLVATRWVEFNLSASELAQRVDGLWVDGDLFGTLEWPMLAGRNFLAEDFRVGAAPTMVISADLWRSTYNADARLIGQTLLVDGEPVSLIGVLAPELSYPFQQQIYVATSLEGRDPLLGLDWSTLLRIEDAVQRQRIEALLATFQAARVARLGPDAEREPVGLARYWSNVTQADAQLMMFALGVLVMLVLLLAATNAGGLLLVQWIGRSRELATRAALGQSLGRSVASLLAEGLSLALLALVIALPLSVWLLGLMEHYLHHSENGMPRYLRLSLSPSVWLWTLLGTLLVSAALVLPTLRRLRRGDLIREMRQGDRGNVAGVHGFSRGLLGLQCALASLTLVVALVCAEGARRELGRPLGFDGTPLLTATFRFSDGERQARFATRLRQAALGLAGVQEASIGGALPLGLVPNRELLVGDQPLLTDYLPADAHYGQAWGFGMRAGSWFSPQDVEQLRPVAVIDQTLADALYAGDAVGRTLPLRDSRWQDQPLTIVGVTDPIRSSMSGGADKPTVFAPVMPAAGYALTLSLRVDGAPQRLVAELRRLGREIDPAVALVDVQSFSRLRWVEADWTRVILSLFAPVGLLAALLAATALTALLGFLVSQREREIGVRRALGANGRKVGSAVLTGLRLPALIGVVLGLGAALLLALPLAGTLYGDRDIAAYASAGAIFMMLLALSVAALAPLRRALRVQPAIVLRGE